MLSAETAPITQITPTIQTAQTGEGTALLGSTLLQTLPRTGPMVLTGATVQLHSGPTSKSSRTSKQSSKSSRLTDTTFILTMMPMDSNKSQEFTMLRR